MEQQPSIEDRVSAVEQDVADGLVFHRDQATIMIQLREDIGELKGYLSGNGNVTVAFQQHDGKQRLRFAGSLSLPVTGIVGVVGGGGLLALVGRVLGLW